MKDKFCLSLSTSKREISKPYLCLLYDIGIKGTSIVSWVIPKRIHKIRELSVLRFFCSKIEFHSLVAVKFRSWILRIAKFWENWFLYVNREYSEIFLILFITCNFLLTRSYISVKAKCPDVQHNFGSCGGVCWWPKWVKIYSLSLE